MKLRTINIPQLKEKTREAIKRKFGKPKEAPREKPRPYKGYERKYA